MVEALGAERREVNGAYAEKRKSNYYDNVLNTALKTIIL